MGDSVGQLKPSEDDDNSRFFTTFAQATILDTLGRISIVWISLTNEPNIDSFESLSLILILYSSSNYNVRWVNLMLMLNYS